MCQNASKQNNLIFLELRASVSTATKNENREFFFCLKFLGLLKEGLKSCNAKRYIGMFSSISLYITLLYVHVHSVVTLQPDVILLVKSFFFFFDGRILLYFSVTLVTLIYIDYN